MVLPAKAMEEILGKVEAEEMGVLSMGLVMETHTLETAGAMGVME